VSFPWWAIPVAFVIWLVIWKGTFGVIEKGVSMLGWSPLLCRGRVDHSSAVGQVIKSALPRFLNTTERITGLLLFRSSARPFLLISFSSTRPARSKMSGRKLMSDQSRDRDRRNEFWFSHLDFGFDTRGNDLRAAGIKFEHYSQLPTLLVPVFGYWGFWLVVASVGIALPRSGNGDHVADGVFHRPGFWLELE
jgi:hypothetical protein